MVWLLCEQAFLGSSSSEEDNDDAPGTTTRTAAQKAEKQPRPSTAKPQDDPHSQVDAVEGRDKASKGSLQDLARQAAAENPARRRGGKTWGSAALDDEGEAEQGDQKGGMQVRGLQLGFRVDGLC